MIIVIVITIICNNSKSKIRNDNNNNTNNSDNTNTYKILFPEGLRMIRVIITRRRIITVIVTILMLTPMDT